MSLRTSDGFYPPFTVHQAEFALYFADPSGMQAAGEAFLTGYGETIEMEQTFEKVRRDTHGSPFGRIRHVDEEHVITFGHLWALQRGPNRPYAPRRDGQHILVIRWEDQETGVWHKRTYFAVTANGEKLSHPSQSYFQEIVFDGRWCAKKSGIGTPPSLLPETSGQVVYVTESEWTPLYEYDFATGIFAEIDSTLLTGRASLVTGVGFMEFRFDGVAALRIEPDLLLAETFTAIGGSFPLGETQWPRLEFRNGPVVLAILTQAGELACPNIQEAEEDPAWENAFSFFLNEIWQASIGQLGLAALNISEELAS